MAKKNSNTTTTTTTTTTTKQAKLDAKQAKLDAKQAKLDEQRTALQVQQDKLAMAQTQAAYLNLVANGNGNKAIMQAQASVSQDLRKADRAGQLNLFYLGRAAYKAVQAVLCNDDLMLTSANLQAAGFTPQTWRKFRQILSILFDGYDIKEDKLYACPASSYLHDIKIGKVTLLALHDNENPYVKVALRTACESITNQFTDDLGKIDFAAMADYCLKAKTDKPKATYGLAHLIKTLVSKYDKESLDDEARAFLDRIKAENKGLY